MKISTLITFGFGIVIAVMLTVAGISVFGTNTSAKGFTEYRGLARDTNLAGRLQANMLMVRMNVKDFLITNSDKDMQQYGEYLEKMNKFLKEAKEEIQKPERAKLIAYVDKEVLSYEKAFDEVVKVIKNRNEKMKDLLSYGLEMRTALTDIMKTAYSDGDPDASYFAGRMQEHVLLARYYALNFLKTSSEKDLETVHYEIGQKIDKLLPTAVANIQNPARIKRLQDFQAARENFKETVDTLAQYVRKRNDIVINRLDKIGPSIAKAVEDVKLSVKADQDALGPQLQKKNQLISTSVLTASALGFVIAVIFSFYIKRTVMKPLGGEPSDMSNLAEKIAQGHLDMVLDKTNATGLYLSMSNMVENLTDIAKSIRSSSESVASGSIQLSSSSEELNTTLSDQTSQVNSIASAMEEMAASSILVLENLNMIIDKSSVAKDKADEGKVKLVETNTSIESIRASSKELSDTINNLSTSSNQISDILDVINDIADQTNLLALNAAIEAARAGEAGRGFAVVADEVRKLAERTQSAIQEVEVIIKSLQNDAGAASKNMQRAENEVENGVNALEATVAVFNSIVDAIEEVVSANNIINTSVAEQNHAIENVNDSIQSVSSGLEQSSVTVHEITKTIDELSQQAEDMNTTVAALRTN